MYDGEFDHGGGGSGGGGPAAETVAEDMVSSCVVPYSTYSTLEYQQLFWVVSTT